MTANGAITDSGNLIVTGTTTLAAGAANNITLNNANNFSTVAVTTGNNVVLNDINALDLGTSTVSGTLGVTTAGALTQSGPLTVAGATTLAAGAGNNITLANGANDFSTVGITSGNNVTLTDVTALDLGASTINGTFNVTAGGLISQSGALSVAGNASFNTTAAATLGSVSLTNGAALTLATSTVGGNLALTTTAGDITLPGGQTLTVAGDASLTAAGTVNLLGTTQIGGTQSFNGGTGSIFVLAADTNLNALALPAAGNITVNLTGTTATFAGAPLLPTAVNLSNAGNNFGGTVSVTTASPALTGTVTNTYNLTQSAAVGLNPGQGLTVTDLGGTAGTRGNITLPNAGNSFNTVTFTGGNIAWQEANAVTIGSVSANAGNTSTGTLSITANGPITQTGVVTAAGPTTLNAMGAGNDITLTNGANDFSTVAVTSGNNVALVDLNALDLGASTVSGTLNVTTGGAITDSGALVVAGTTTLNTAGDIILDTPTNNFSTVTVTNGNNVTLVDTNALDLGASTVSGTLNVTTGGAITDSGALVVTGPTTLNAAGDIILDTATNNFSTVAVTNGNNVTLVDTNALVLGASTISGTLNVTTSGALTQSGAVTVTGATTLAAGPANDITLNNGANDFSTVAVTSGNNVALTDATALDLGASTVNGTLTVTATGALTLNGATVGGNLSLNGNSITLASAPISVTAGSATLSAATTIIQNVDLTTAGAGSVNVTTTSGAITMSPTATTSSGTGTINYMAGTDVTLGALNTGGAVNVTAQGGSILSAGGAATHITAGANSTLQALGGIVGTLALPITVSVNPGSLGVAATAQAGGFSGVLTGTVVPSNTLNLLNVPPGCVSFNGVCVSTGGGGTGGPGGISPSLLTKGTIVYLNPDVIVPTYNEKPSGSTTIQRQTSVYVPASVLEPSEVLISGGNEQRGTIASLVPKQATRQLGSQPISSPQVDLLRVDYFVSHIEFEPGQADLSPTGREILMQVSQLLKSVADMRIQIEGHTDNMPISPRLLPKFPSNLALAKARATNAVRCLVEDGGIDPATISTVARADTRPVASNATAEGRKKNRRIEIVLVPKDRPEAAPRSSASQPAR